MSFVPMPAEGVDEITDDAVLGARLSLRQPRRGHRVGHDAILLAAACPARAGERVVELGAGVGAAGLALAVRVPGTLLTLVEVDPALAALAQGNAQRNGLAGSVSVAVLDVAGPAQAFVAAGLAPGAAARVLINPPFNDPDRHRSSPDRARRLAHVGQPTTVALSVSTAARLLRSGGTLSMIWRASGMPEVLDALAGSFGAITVLPVHPKPRAAAIRLLLRASKNSRAPFVLLSPLVLNDETGIATPESAAVLREHAALPLAEP